jgi:hypothetical protein
MPKFKIFGKEITEPKENFLEKQVKKLTKP